MFRKMTIALCISLIFSLLGSGGMAFASNGPSRPMPTWQTVFDPNAKTPDTNYFIQSIEVFKGDLYAVAGDPLWWHTGSPASFGGQIFRSADGKNWEPASAPGFGLGQGPSTNDCSTDYYITAEDMTVFQGKLYVAPIDGCYERPGVIMRSSDGKNWENVGTTQEFKINWLYNDTTYFGQFDDFGEFNGMLYVGVDYYDPGTNLSMAAIFRSRSGDPGTWKEVIIFPGWGQPGPFHVFKGALYVVSNNVSTADRSHAPEQIWRTYDGVKWEEVVSDGFGIPGTWWGLGGLADYQGYLYVGVATYDDSTNTSTGGQIWRSQDGKHWEQVIKNGFGNPNDIKIDGLVVYQGELYAYTVNTIDGGSVFRTRDAKTWERVNQPGWGNPSYYTSHKNSDQAIFKGDLYMGVIGLKGALLKMIQ